MLTSCYSYTLSDQIPNGPFKVRPKTLHKTEVRLTGRQLAACSGPPFLNSGHNWKVFGMNIVALNGPPYGRSHHCGFYVKLSYVKCMATSLGFISPLHITYTINNCTSKGQPVFNEKGSLWTEFMYYIRVEWYETIMRIKWSCKWPTKTPSLTTSLIMKSSIVKFGTQP